MMSKLRHQLISFVLFGLLASVYPAWGVETGITNEWKAYLWPSYSIVRETPSELRLRIACSDIFTGKLLDCAFTYKVPGLKPPPELSGNNGGHNHNFDTHPLIDPPDGALQFDGMDLDPSKLGISGQTLNTRVLIKHPMPQVAGKIQVETIITAPRGYECVYRCWTKTSNRNLGTIDVEIGLEPISLSGEGCWRLTGQTTTHPDNHYGTLSTTGALGLIATDYFKATERSLGINDMSLPKGGMFDVCGTWNPKDSCTNPNTGRTMTGHNTHRTGTDADIDRDGINCKDDWKLRRAIEIVNEYGYVAGGQPKARLKCESGGRKHIDFD